MQNVQKPGTEYPADKGTGEKNKPVSQGWGLLLVIIATLCLSTEAVAAKIAYRGGATVMTALVVRYAIAAFIFWAVTLLWRMPWRLGARRFWQVVLVAVAGQATTVLCLFYAFQYIPAGMAILFLYFYPTFVTILAYFFLNEALTSRKVLALVLTLTGAAVILGQPVHGLDLRGVGLSVLAAVFNAGFFVAGARLLKDMSVWVFDTYIVSIVGVIFMAMGLAGGTLHFGFDVRTWWALIFLGVMTTVIALAAMFKGIELLGASRASIISTMEPAFTALLGYWLLSEVLTGAQIVGGALILVGVLLQVRE
ncbi:MAG: DMT family transporter [Peptococcaceae bacterium]|nr:DMT family transporter [Peptococcaceae bacterium]